jgi:hypothetical protein
MNDQEKAEAWREANKAWASTVLIAGILAVAAWIFATSGFSSPAQKEVAHVIVWLPGLWAGFQLLGFYRFPRQNVTNLLIIALCCVIFVLSACSRPKEPTAPAPQDTETSDEQNRIVTLINHCKDIIVRRGETWPKPSPQTLAEVPCTIEEMRGERRKFVEAYYQRHPDHKREVDQ